MLLPIQYDSSLMSHNPAWAEAFRTELLAYGRQLLRSQSTLRLDVADIVQTTLLAASQVPPPSTLRVAQLAWLKAALQNDFRDEVRRVTAGKRDILRECQLGSADPAAEQESPARPLKKAEEIRKLLTHLDELPAEQQQALRLRYLDGLSVEQVAVQLKKTRPAVAGLLRRGLDALREKYDTRPTL